MIESWRIRPEMGILLLSSELFSNPSPKLKSIDAAIYYGGFENKDEKKLFNHNKSLF